MTGPNTKNMGHYKEIFYRSKYDVIWFFWLSQDTREGGGEGAASGPFWQGLPTLDAGQDPRGRHEGHHLEEDGEHQEVAVLPRSVNRRSLGRTQVPYGVVHFFLSLISLVIGFPINDLNCCAREEGWCISSGAILLVSWIIMTVMYIPINICQWLAWSELKM